MCGGGGVGRGAEPGPGLGEEPIRFSSVTNAVQPPDADDVSGRTSRGLETLDRANSLSGAVDRPGGAPPAPLPAQNLSSRWWERLERDKNWLSNSPDDLVRMPTAEEVMGIWEYNLDRALARDGSRALEAMSTAANMPPSDSPLTADFQSRRALGPRVGANLSDALGAALGAEPASATFLLPVTPRSPKPAQQSALNWGTPGLSSDPLRLDIRDLLGNPAGGLNPLATGFDPINLRSDSTRREVQPVTAPTLSELGAVQRFDTALSLPAARAAGSAPSSTLLDEMNAKILGPSSLSPALTTPVEQPKPKPQPRMRESLGRKL